MPNKTISGHSYGSAGEDREARSSASGGERRQLGASRDPARSLSASSLFTIILPIGHSEIGTSLRCAQAKGMPMMVIAPA
jgi:hypothetical protein